MGRDLIDRPLRSYDVRLRDEDGAERTMCGVRAYDQHDALTQAIHEAVEETGLDEWFLVRMGLSKAAA